MTFKHEITATQFAVDREGEQCQVPENDRKFKSGTLGPNLFEQLWALRAQSAECCDIYKWQQHTATCNCSRGH